MAKMSMRDGSTMALFLVWSLARRGFSRLDSRAIAALRPHIVRVEAAVDRGFERIIAWLDPRPDWAVCLAEDTDGLQHDLLSDDDDLESWRGSMSISMNDARS